MRLSSGQDLIEAQAESISSPTSQSLQMLAARSDIEQETVSTEEIRQRAAALKVESLLTTLAEERRKQQCRTRRYQVIGLSIVAVVLLCTGAVWIKTGKFPSDILSSFSSMAGLIGLTAAATRGQKQATRELAQFNDVRAVGPLAEALTFEDKQVRQVAKEALTRLLPRLQAGDAPLLNSEQRHILHRCLYRRKFRFDQNLALAILNALRQVGDERDLPVVQRLAQGTGKYDHSRKIQMEAQDCLPFLQKRAEEQAARQSLLRAAVQPIARAEELVRPVMESMPEESWNLLRACLPDGTTPSDSETETIQAILRHLETTADPRALPYVEQLAASPTLSEDLRPAVERCVARLQAATGQDFKSAGG